MTEKKKPGRPRKPEGPRIPGKKPTTRAGRKAAPKCGATTTTDGTPCENAAGFKTAHPGEGRCYYHGGVGQKPSQRYQDMQAPERLSKLLQQFAADDDPLNLLPDLATLRALLTYTIEVHAALTAALLAWHASYSVPPKLWLAAVSKWQDEIRMLSLSGTAPEDLPLAPSPEQFAGKPLKLPDLMEAYRLLDKIGSMAERIKKMQETGTISLAKLDAVLEELAVQTVEAAREVRLDETQRTALLAAIERRWGGIDLATLPVAPDPGTTAGRTIN